MFNQLYIQTEYSILQSSCKLEPLFERLVKDKVESCAIVDEGTMYGTIKFYQACLRNKIKPIIGLKVNYLYDDMNSSLLLYAINDFGYKNLMKISSRSRLNNGIVDFEYLTKASLGLIAIIPFDESILSRYHQHHDDKAIFQIIDILKHTYDILYIGLPIPQALIGFNFNEVYHFYKNKGYKLVALPKVSYLNSDEMDAYITLKSIKMNAHLYKPLEAEKYHYLLEQEEVEFLFREYQDLIDATIEIASLCHVEIEFGKYQLPLYQADLDTSVYLKELCLVGLKKRIQNFNYSYNYQIYLKRLNDELNTINQMGFNDYFLIVYDYVKFAKKKGIFVGPGRGSAPASLVSYVLGITEVDPIYYNLLFERFLNPERVTMPDIDIDFDSEKRGLVTDYVMNKYGEKRAIGIITFNTLGAKQVIRDVGRVLNISLPIIDEIAKAITTKNLKDSYVVGSKFHRIINSNPDYIKLYNASIKLEGLPRHISVHAAGVVMSNIDIDVVIPLYKNPLGMYVSAFSKDYLEPLGLLKMDFLGLDNLTLISNVIEEIRKNEGINISFEKIPLDDKKTLKVFRDVDTDGIFQFESVGMKRFLSKLKVNSFDDIATALALYRPGPMDNIDLFIARREGRERVDYIHPDLEDILKPTYGIIIYQEQIMQIVRKMASYSYGEADILRRAMSKKKESIILAEKPKFIKGCLDNGYDERTATEVYDLILKFANYGFNKSHSVSYAITAYKMAFIKTYFLKYFIAGILTNSIGNTSKINIYVNRARKSLIKILPPDINESSNKFYAGRDGIRCPLSIINGVGTSISNDIINERENGKFTDPIDFIVRMSNKGINKKTISNLIYARAINFGYNKNTLIQNLDTILNYADIGKDAGMIETLKPEIILYDEYDKNELISLELKTIGFYLTEHPASKYRDDSIIVNTSNISDFFDKRIFMIVMISRLKETTTKNNDVMAFIVGSDEFGEVDLTCFPDVYKKFNNIKVGNIIKIFGRVEKRYDKYQVIINNISILE